MIYKDKKYKLVKNEVGVVGCSVCQLNCHTDDLGEHVSDCVNTKKGDVRKYLCHWEKVKDKIKS